MMYTEGANAEWLVQVVSHQGQNGYSGDLINYCDCMDSGVNHFLYCFRNSWTFRKVNTPV